MNISSNRCQVQKLKSGPDSSFDGACPADVEAKFAAYENLLREWNGKMNLVAPGTISDIRHRHIDDAAQISKYIPPNKTIIDLGSGAGLPAIILAILGRNVIAIESVGKKCRFMETVRQELNLSNLIIINDRIENAIPKILAGEIPNTACLHQNDPGMPEPMTIITGDGSEKSEMTPAGSAVCRRVAKHSGQMADMPSKNVKNARQNAQKSAFFSRNFIFTARAFAPLIRILNLTKKLDIPYVLLKGKTVADEIALARGKHRFNAKLYPSETGDGFVIKLTIK